MTRRAGFVQPFPGTDEPGSRQFTRREASLPARIVNTHTRPTSVGPGATRGGGRAIRAVVEMQRSAGLQSATDGEFRRASWHMDFIYQLGGIETAPGDITIHFQNEDGEIEYTPAAIHVGDKVHLDHTIFEDDLKFLADVAGDGSFQS